MAERGDFLHLDPSERAELLRWNARLRRMPRLRMRAAFARAAIQAGLLLAERVIRPDLRGVDVEMRRISVDRRTITLRVLHPQGAPRGFVLDMHGGAWVVGTARMDDLVNSDLARQGFVVASIEYGLAPRNGIADIIAECSAAARWIVANGAIEFGTDALVIRGESAGAHLAAASLVHLGPDRGAFAGAALLYGVYDLGGSDMVRAAGPDTLIMHGPGMIAGLETLLPGLDEAGRRDPALSPLFADVSGMPPALMIACGRDPLEADTLAMAARWQAANGNCRLVRIADAPHAMNRMPTAAARRVNRLVADFIAESCAEGQARAASQ